MSDFVDFMLNGVVCEGCGQLLDGATGFPRTCEACTKPGIDVRFEPHKIQPEAVQNCTAPEKADDDLPF